LFRKNFDQVKNSLERDRLGAFEAKQQEKYEGWHHGLGTMPEKEKG